MADGAFEYIPRKPEETVLYGVIAEQLETFLARRRECERPIPRFVEREFRDYLTCGVLEHGFLRVHCDSCGKDRVVPFSCRGRGWCPSCGGRRMADTAAHLVDRVLPWVPVRQWVLSLPFALRYRLAYDASLMSDVLNVFARAVSGELRRRARESFGLGSSQSGAVTFVQRFGGALNLNIHFHLLSFDGVYMADEGGRPEFHELPPPEDAEVVRLTTLVASRILSLIERRGLKEGADALSQNDPGLAALYAAAVQSRIAAGPNAGNRVGTFGGDHIDGDSLESLASPRCATISGFSVHANVSIGARDRQRLERLVRYCARPALATERLSKLSNGKLAYRWKHPWRNGTTDVVFEPQDLIAKLAALVPAPRVHLTRFYVEHRVMWSFVREGPRTKARGPRRST
jgi:Putative transposase/Transposase zinc-binding domain